jgi:hypothetical protein
MSIVLDPANDPIKLSRSTKQNTKNNDTQKFYYQNINKHKTIVPRKYIECEPKKVEITKLSFNMKDTNNFWDKQFLL